MLFSERLVLLRKSHNLTQKQLSLALNMSVIAIQHYESQRRKPAFDVLLPLANYFDVPVDYLTGQGIFAQWDTLMEHKGDVFDALMAHNPVFCKMQLDRLSEKDLMRLFAGVLSNVTISEDGAFSIDVYPFWIDRP